MKYFIVFILSLNFTYADVGFSSLTKADLDGISEEFLANFTHTSVSSSNRLGALFGFEVGIIGGITDAPKLKAVTQKFDPSSSEDKLPHAGLLGRVSIPFNLTAEVSLIPTVGDDKNEFSRMSFALQWNFFEFTLFDFAAKAHYGSSTFDITQTIGSDVDGKVEYKNSTYGVMVMGSASVLLFEPYVGLGFVKGSSDISFTASSGTIFDPSLSTGTSAESSPSSAHIIAGMGIDLWLINLGLEFDHLFGTSRYSAKFTVGF